MRGKVLNGFRDNPYYRITPAYAGKSLVTAKPAFPDQDHPRLCGEKLSEIPFIQSSHRITPAYAGKSRIAAGACLQRRDHPRLCGEKPVKFLLVALGAGSPPPMRGITPAYAGKSVCHFRQ